ncbi:hypothetical protein COP1_037732 [Malus domestica]
MRLSSSIGTTSTFVVLNQTNAWSRTYRWSRPWLVVTPCHLAPTFLPISSAAWLRRPFTRSTHTRMVPSGSFNSGCKFTSPPFDRQSSISCQRKRLGLSWPLDQHPPHQAEEVFRYFFALDDLSNDEFLICHRREYPSSIKLPTSMWGADEDADLRQS